MPRLNVADGRIEIKVGGKRIVVTAAEILTDGKTRLNNGTRPTHYKGGIDSDGDVAKSGADGVLVYEFPSRTGRTSSLEIYRRKIWSNMKWWLSKAFG